MRLPFRSNLDHLKKQAKDLLRSFRDGDPTAIERISSLSADMQAPTASTSRQATPVRLHDAQLCIAREYGFSSWTDMKAYVDMQNAGDASRHARVLRWLQSVYSSDVTGTAQRARPLAAQRMLLEDPSLGKGDPYLACAVGDVDALRNMIAADSAWVHRAGGPLNLPPLVAVTHSGFVRLQPFNAGLQRCARLLLDAGADPDLKIADRSPPATLSNPSSENFLSALYGAAGNNGDAGLTALLLERGADPNDGESLYHSLDHPECTRLLLEAGARITGTNALYRVFDLDNLASLQLLLAHGADPNEPAGNAPLTDFGSPLLWAIGRRRSRAHVEALLEAGADASATTPGGISAYRLALRSGLTEIADLLRDGSSEASVEEQFLGACARADEAEAGRIQSLRPDLPAALAETELRLLPDSAAQGANDAVRLMVKIGWPIAARGGDFQASALNWAVFRGDPALTHFLLDYGASWRETHGYGDNVIGSLSWASFNEPEGCTGDWIGCAEALVAHGFPTATSAPEHPGLVLIDGRLKYFSEEVTEFLLSENGTA